MQIKDEWIMKTSWWLVRKPCLPARPISCQHSWQCLLSIQPPLSTVQSSPSKWDSSNHHLCRGLLVCDVFQDTLQVINVGCRVSLGSLGREQDAMWYPLTDYYSIVMYRRTGSEYTVTYWASSYVRYIQRAVKQWNQLLAYHIWNLLHSFKIARDLALYWNVKGCGFNSHQLSTREGFPQRLLISLGEGRWGKN